MTGRTLLSSPTRSTASNASDRRQRLRKHSSSTEPAIFPQQTPFFNDSLSFPVNNTEEVCLHQPPPFQTLASLQSTPMSVASLTRKRARIYDTVSNSANQTSLAISAFVAFVSTGFGLKLLCPGRKNRMKRIVSLFFGFFTVSIALINRWLYTEFFDGDDNNNFFLQTKGTLMGWFAHDLGDLGRIVLVSGLSAFAGAIGWLVQKVINDCRQDEEEEKNLARWRHPLLTCAWDLQHRLWGFRPEVGNTDEYWQNLGPQSAEWKYFALHTTYQIARLFAQFRLMLSSDYFVLNPEGATSVRKVILDLQSAFSQWRVSLQLGSGHEKEEIEVQDPTFMTWKGHQDAIGEMMCVSGQTIMGFAEFQQKLLLCRRVRNEANARGGILQLRASEAARESPWLNARSRSTSPLGSSSRERFSHTHEHRHREPDELNGIQTEIECILFADMFDGFMENMSCILHCMHHGTNTIPARLLLIQERLVRVIEELDPDKQMTRDYGYMDKNIHELKLLMNHVKKEQVMSPMHGYVGEYALTPSPNRVMEANYERDGIMHQIQITDTAVEQIHLHDNIEGIDLGAPERSTNTRATRASKRQRSNRVSR